MIDYRGRYRVILEVDKHTGKPGEFSVIPCRIYRGANICRQNEDTLNVYLPGLGKKRLKLFLERYPIFRIHQEGDSECTLLFGESDIEEAAVILKPFTQGKAVSPRSRTKNLRFAS